MFAITESMVVHGALPSVSGSTTRRHYRGRNYFQSDVAEWSHSPSLPADQPYWDDMFSNSIRIGVAAAKSTFKPALCVWALMMGLAALYYLVPASHTGFDALAGIQENYGLLFSSLGMGLSVGILVECVRVLMSQRKKWTLENSVNAGFNFTIWSFMGLTQYYRYNWQVEVFGEGNSFRELVTKVGFDQFIWTAFFANPYQAILYLWKNNNFSWKAVRRLATPFKTFWGTQMLPMLISNWAFWIPMAFLVYYFPPELQIPMAILAVTIWVILLSYLTAASQNDEQ